MCLENNTVCVRVCVYVWLYNENWSLAANVLRESQEKEWSKLH